MRVARDRYSDAMCRRYVLAVRPEQVAERFGMGSAPGLPASYNVGPGTYMPVLVGRGGPQIDFMQWGLVPPWAKTASGGARAINAAAETVAEHPAYRAALRYGRCLVPANGWYAWRSTRPYFVHLRDEPLFAFAGLYAVWYDPDGTELRSYSIVTCAASTSLAGIDARMPVILPRAAESAWLDQRETRSAALLPLLRPYPAEALLAYRVSPAVNARHNDGAPLIAPVD